MTSDAQIINQLGGTVAVAKLCQVRHQAVSRWKKSGIPPARLMYLRLRFPEAFQESPVEAECQA